MRARLGAVSFHARVVGVLVTVGIACSGEAAWIHAKACVAQMLIAYSWRRAEAGAVGAKPWPWADTRPVARLTFEPAARQMVVLDGANGRNLAFGPTHDPASVLPGEVGNSIIEGHRDTHFAVLRDLRVGDRLRTDLPDGRAFRFVVVERRVVDSRRWRLLLDAGAPRLTLVTCYPFDAIAPGGPLRLVITSELSAESAL